MIENVKCPDCGGPMVSRSNRQTGQRFWGCKAYPDCKGTRDTDGEARSDRTSDRDDRSGAFPSERAQQNDRARWRHQ
jgi:ssDNA-binding Zn-finger/Zn-ribbon topoisomerase 1